MVTPLGEFVASAATVHHGSPRPDTAAKESFDERRAQHPVRSPGGGALWAEIRATAHAPGRVTQQRHYALLRLLLRHRHDEHLGVMQPYVFNEILKIPATSRAPLRATSRSSRRSSPSSCWSGRCAVRPLRPQADLRRRLPAARPRLLPVPAGQRQLGTRHLPAVHRLRRVLRQRHARGGRQRLPDRTVPGQDDRRGLHLQRPGDRVTAAAHRRPAQPLHRDGHRLGLGRPIRLLVRDRPLRAARQCPVLGPQARAPSQAGQARAVACDAEDRPRGRAQSARGAGLHSRPRLPRRPRRRQHVPHAVARPGRHRAGPQHRRRAEEGHPVLRDHPGHGACRGRRSSAGYSTGSTGWPGSRAP